MTSEVTDVLEAVQSFIAKGYDREYRVKDGNLVDLELGSILDACTIGYRKFNRPFLRVWRVGSGRASAALG
ncbi:hypothetical protein PV764_20155, partial [Stenotrophomonas sp. AS1]